VDLVKENPRKIARMLGSLQRTKQRMLYEWMPTADKDEICITQRFLSMPVRINWKAVSKAYEFQPRNYEELLGIRGIGSATIRGLALISEIIYGEEPSWKDPVKYSFAYGGKDGVPFPVDRKAMDESINILKQAVENAKIGKNEKLLIFKKLKEFIPSNS